MIKEFPCQLRDLGFAWSAVRLTNNSLCRGLVHSGPHQCLQQILVKLVDTGRVASKYYLMFHVIPLILRLRKAKEMKSIPREMAKCFYEYIKSCCFMSFLVALLRVGFCSNPNLKHEHLMYIASPISALSILFEDPSRRSQVTAYVSAKAIRSVYISFKRRRGLRVRREVVYMHILMMALLYYVYNHRPTVLKFRNLFEIVFGDE